MAATVQDSERPAQDVLADYHRQLQLTELNELNFTSVVEGRTFHCIKWNGDTCCDSRELRRRVLKQDADGKPHASLIQVVGDSGTGFDPSKIDRAKEAFASRMQDDVFVEYGYTYQYGDTNWIVSDYLDSQAEARPRSIANVVDKSVEILSPGGPWLASPHVEQFVLLYSPRNGSPTTFGDDTFLSDSLMLAEAGDVMICLEGGAQSFYQCVDALIWRIPVIALTDLRPAGVKVFSAAQLLIEFKNKGFSTDAVTNYFGTLLKTEEQKLPRIQEQLDRLLHYQRDLAELILER